MRRSNLLTAIGGCIFAITSGGCSHGNNLLFGRVEAAVGSHTVVVTDCYRTSVPPPETMPDTSDGRKVYRFTPCTDADVWIRGDALEVNGKSYGRLDSTDSVLVDHGVVSVHKSKGQ